MYRFVLFYLIILVKLYTFPVCGQSSSQTQEKKDFTLGKGIEYLSTNQRFSLTSHVRIQNSLSQTYYTKAESSGFNPQMSKLRLSFGGFYLHPKLTYRLQLGLGAGDLDYSSPDLKWYHALRDVLFFYQLNPNLSVGLGQGKIASSHQRRMSSNRLQLTERSLNSKMFDPERDIGLFLNYTPQRQDQFIWHLRTALTWGEGKNRISQQHFSPAFTGRIELFPLGSFWDKSLNEESSLTKEQKPKLMLAAAYQFHYQAAYSMGNKGDVLFDARDLHTFFFDILYKYQGTSVLATYRQRYTEYPMTFNPGNLLQNDYVMAGKGIDFQAGYFFLPSYEVVGRYSWQKMQQEVHKSYPHAQQLAWGINKYIYGHALKLQGEAAYTIQKHVDQSESRPWYFGLQLEFVF